ncbi:hypothetical protein U3A58_14870 [Algoriphagus sp. C2-6-M1]|uniref:hypothetical protein n=1 Tax=Algoriphagus persicinus TaxID=3108754 RepID=UPI002B3820D0|nr:hypothetical protein [Algoriphagus sp. C2-6-M1]MEB2781678.1 hypothetical protein [Algoriphagus sp. C2-6-M1]
MKKLFVSILIVVGGALSLFIPTDVFALQDYPWYEENDYCGFSSGGACQAVVIKCRYVGGDYCIVFEQIPCEEKCPNAYPY